MQFIIESDHFEKLTHYSSSWNAIACLSNWIIVKVFFIRKSYISPGIQDIVVLRSSFVCDTFDSCPKA